MKKCPLCKGSLVIRCNKKTKSPFLGCENYPRCRHNEPLNSGQKSRTPRGAGVLIQALDRIKSERYQLYLQSEQWQKKRDAIIEMDGGTCQVCSGQRNLQVHHLTYARVYREEPYDLVTVCRKCHEAIHKL